jgi:hypothetical protein
VREWEPGTCTLRPFFYTVWLYAGPDVSVGFLGVFADVFP